MKTDPVYPLSDVMVKYIFGSRKAVHITADFLKAILDLDPQEFRTLRFGDPHLGRRWKKDKLSIVDILLNTVSGKVLHIEVQIQSYAEMISRILYYQARLITEQVEAGDKYGAIQEVVTILILDWVLLKEEPAYKNTFRLLNTETHKPFTNLQTIITIELPKVPEEDDGTELWPWVQYLRCRTEEEFDMLIKTHPEVGAAVQRYRRRSPIKWVRQKLFEYYDAKRCEAAHDDYVRQEAIEKEQALFREQLAAKDQQIAIQGEQHREQLAVKDQQIAAQGEQHQQDREQLATQGEQIRQLQEELRRLRG